MLDKQALKSTYDRVAEAWRDDHKADDWCVPGTEKLLTLLHKGANVLDVGCGCGIRSRQLVDAGMNVTGIDFSSGQIEIAKRDVPEAEFLVMDMYDIASLDKKFDCVFAQASLLHVPKKDVAEVLKGFKKVLKPGGIIYVVVKEIRDGQSEEEIKKEERYGGMERFFSYYTVSELEGYLADLEAEIIDSDSTFTGRTNWIHVIARV